MLISIVGMYYWNLSRNCYLAVSLMNLSRNCCTVILENVTVIYITPIIIHPTGHDSRQCARVMWDIVRQEGARNLMKGLLPRLIAVPSMMSWFYMINEELEWAFLHTRHV